MLIVRHREVAEALDGKAAELTDLAEDVYRAHDQGRSSVPHSVFLRFPGDTANRIIALPAYLDGKERVAGIKWVASFPGNIDRGLQRASATIILNSPATGYPEALIEASLISAKRTAASAALAAKVLAGAPDGITLIGCGVINSEILRFTTTVLPSIARVTLFDRDRERAAEFARRASAYLGSVPVTVEADRDAAMATNDLISIATTAASPHMSLDACQTGSTVLHISLRDLTPQAILTSRNVVDDADHVCRERTSLHLAEQLTGDRAFIDASIGALLAGRVTLRRDPAQTVVFSPFGLGILDVAVAQLVFAEVSGRGAGLRVPDFLPRTT
ncbi:MAG TPA: 2,3-diaminopropionate biosynthesis protein SbnB [Streptosporangiaceae bacterium]